MFVFVIAAKQIAKAGVDFLFPRCCIGCGKVSDFICGDCCHKLPRILPPLCQKCGKSESTGFLCPSCWGWRSQIDGIRAPFRFEGMAKDVVHALKYYNFRALAQPMAELMAVYLSSSRIPGDVLVPVPLHRRRLKERGYNQSELLVSALGKIIGMPVADDVLYRIKDSLPQVRTTSVEERYQNVRGAFACKNGSEITGRAVIVVDDVSTSGATLEACADALKTAGAISVWGLTFAREV